MFYFPFIFQQKSSVSLFIVRKFLCWLGGENHIDEALALQFELELEILQRFGSIFVQRNCMPC